MFKRVLPMQTFLMKKTQLRMITYSAAYGKQEKLLKLFKKYEDPIKPKYPMNPFHKFYWDHINKNNIILKGKNKDEIKSIYKTCSDKWKIMGKPIKDQYVSGFSDEMKKYNEELKKYKNSGKEKSWKKKLVKHLDNKPPINGYYGFLKENWQTQKNTNNNIKYYQFVKLYAKEWNQLPQNKKDAYKQKYSDKYRKWKAQIILY
mmetsp:Transcript_34328/g.42275  ORF Transcript_34328/g.42275 Transcript_34328/m.42275 type:complete len:203 (+) Transcript_34328:40-648(+)